MKSINLSSIDLKGAGALLGKVKKNLSIALWVFLAIIALLTGLVIFNEVNKVSQVQTDDAGILDRITKVNLDKHKEIEKTLDEHKSFEPVPVAGSDIFAVPPQLQD